MRADMYKVIVERPRLVHGNWLGGGREVGFRQFMASDERPVEARHARGSSRPQKAQRKPRATQDDS
jgi:hypothetical protein